MPSEDTVRVPLTQGKEAIIDAADAPWVLRQLWFANESNPGRWYAKGYVCDRGTYLHRYIVNAKPGDIVDHIDGDTLNDRRSNLRLTTQSSNMSNQRLRSNNTTGFRGASWNKRNQNWVAYITVNGKRLWLGVHETAEAAARAHDVAAKAHFGPLAQLNFPEDDSHG